MAFLLWSTGTSFAEAVVVKGDKIFIADDSGLRVLDLADGELAECSGKT